MDKEQKRILIQKINHLPTLPTILTKIIELTDSRSGNANVLGDILAKDQSITSTILKLVNSAFYGNLRHISSINHATVILGFPMVKTIAMGVSIFQAKPDDACGFDREAFWVHSLGVAAAAKMLSQSLTLPQHLHRDTVFLGGLLHDVGKVIFDNYFFEEYRMVHELVRTEGLWIGDAELRVMHMNHCDAGFYLSRKWQFPEPVVEAIRFHHQLEKCSDKFGLVCALVHTADHICRKIRLGSGGDDLEVELDPLVATRFGITQVMVDEATASLERERAGIESFITD